jgi:hypothetical protein
MPFAALFILKEEDEDEDKEDVIVDVRDVDGLVAANVYVSGAV